MVLLINPLTLNYFSKVSTSKIMFTQKGYQEARLFVNTPRGSYSLLAGRFQVSTCQENDKYSNTISQLDIYNDFLKFPKNSRGEIISTSSKKANKTTTSILGDFTPLFNYSFNPGFCSMLSNMSKILLKTNDGYLRYNPNYLKQQYPVESQTLANNFLYYYSDVRLKFTTQNGNLVLIQSFDKDNLSQEIYSIHFSEINL